MNDRRIPETDISPAPDWVRHRRLRDWVAEMVRLAKPERVVWCDGSQAEYERLCAELVAAGLKPIPAAAPFKWRDGSDQRPASRLSLAHEVVRHVGEPVALIVAETAA